jgi:hypothetical protein
MLSRHTLDLTKKREAAGGVGGKHPEIALLGGRRLHRLVRSKLLHVAIATVAARAQGMEVAETLMGSRQSGGSH